MRTRRFFNDREVVLHYKSHIMSYIEYRTPGLYHACDSTLRPLDKVQSNLFAELGISDEQALRSFNLAPLRSRRDMAMLGLIHRTVLGKGPAQFQTFFRLAPPVARRGTRFAHRRHSRQLVDPRGPRFSEQLRRSALGLIAIYNLLPGEIVGAESVSDFQRSLQDMMKAFACSNVEGWPDLFSPRVPLFSHLLK